MTNSILKGEEQKKKKKSLEKKGVLPDDNYEIKGCNVKRSQIPPEFHL